MKKIIFVLFILYLNVHAQTIPPILVWYDIDLADTSVDGLTEKNIPVFSTSTKEFIANLWKDILDKKYNEFYRYTLNPTLGGLTFPILDLDSSYEANLFPPYDSYQSVTAFPTTLNHLWKIRIYETWSFKNWNLAQDNYEKKLVAWSFILRPPVPKGVDKEDDFDPLNGYSFNYMLREWGGRVGIKGFEPYIFLVNSSHIDYLRRNLDHWGNKRQVPHQSFDGVVDKPDSKQELLVYDLYFPDTIKEWDTNVNLENAYSWDMPQSRIPFLNNLFSDIKSGKYFQYDYYKSSIYEETSDFPITGGDSTQIQSVYPPYNFRDTVFYHYLEPEKIVGIRYFEKRENKKNALTSTPKKLIAWTFLTTGIKESYNREMTITIPCGYIFINDKNDLPYLKRKLNK